MVYPAVRYHVEAQQQSASLGPQPSALEAPAGGDLELFAPLGMRRPSAQPDLIVRLFSAIDNVPNSRVRDAAETTACMGAVGLVLIGAGLEDAKNKIFGKLQ